MLTFTKCLAIISMSASLVSYATNAIEKLCCNTVCLNTLPEMAGASAKMDLQYTVAHILAHCIDARH